MKNREISAVKCKELSSKERSSKELEQVAQQAKDNKIHKVNAKTSTSNSDSHTTPPTSLHKSSIAVKTKSFVKLKTSKSFKADFPSNCMITMSMIISSRI